MPIRAARRTSSLRGFALCWLLLCAACASPEVDRTVGVPDADADYEDAWVEEVANTPDHGASAALDVAAADNGVDTAPPSPPDFGPQKPPPLPCALDLVPEFQKLAKPHLGPCVKCHNSAAPSGFISGPQWLNPNKAEDTITALVLTGLLDPEVPAESLFVLKPLEQWDGGATHAGDGFFMTDSPEYEDLVAFATAAASCAADHPPSQEPVDAP